VIGKRRIVGRLTLRDLAFVVREDIINAAAVNVERRAKIFARHGRAFDVPARITYTPGAIPAEEMFWFGTLPQGKIRRVALAVSAKRTCARLLLLKPTVRQLAITGPG